VTTKLYLHLASQTSTGTLPQTCQLGSYAGHIMHTGSDAATTNRAMDTTIGTTQSSITTTSIADVLAHEYYFAKWVSPPLNQTNVAANTWTFNLAVSSSSGSAHFGIGIRINNYVWRPSTNALVGWIIKDSPSPTGFANVTVVNQEQAENGTATGGASVNCAVGDVIVFELWITVTQSATTSFTDKIFFDGTTENHTTNAVVSNYAAFLSTPENLVFQGGILTNIGINENLGSVTDAINIKPIRIVAQSVSISETLKKTAILKAIVESDGSISEAVKKKALQHISEPDIIHHDVDMIAKKAKLIPADSTISVSDTLTKNKVRSIMDTAVSVSDSIRRNIGRSIVQTIATSESVKKKALLGILQALSISELVRKTAIFHIVEVALTVSSIVLKKQIKSIVQTITVSETVKKKAILKVLENLGAISDNITQTGKHFISRNIIEPALAISEVVTVVAKLKSGGRRLLGIRSAYFSRGKVRRRFILFHRPGAKQQDI
jgi:hypothetical protein